jgi:hypothetical protein
MAAVHQAAVRRKKKYRTYQVPPATASEPEANKDSELGEMNNTDAGVEDDVGSGC